MRVFTHKNNFTRSPLYLCPFFDVKICCNSPYDTAIVYIDYLLLIKMFLFVIEGINDMILSLRCIGNDHFKVSFHQCVLIKPFHYVSVLKQRR